MKQKWLELLTTCSALAHHGNHAAAIILAASVRTDRLLDRDGFDAVVQGGSLRRLRLLAVKLEENDVTENLVIDFNASCEIRVTPLIYFPFGVFEPFLYCLSDIRGGLTSMMV